MKKIALLILFSAAAFCIASGQKKFYSKKPYTVNLQIKKSDKVSVKEFGRIILQDCRKDTADMGVTFVYLKEGVSRLIFQQGLEVTLNKGLNKLVESGTNDDTLFININDFWFQEAYVKSGWAHAAIFNSTRLESRLYLNADFYIASKGVIAKKGNIDTIFRRNRWMPDNCDELAESALKSMILLTKQFSDGLQESITRDYFATVSRKCILPPILRDSVFKKGVYANYQQFLENSPDSIDFTITGLKKSVLLTYKVAGDTSADRAWGFCDGKDVYIHLDSSYYKMVKMENKFFTSAPLTIEIINSFATRALKRTLHTGLFIYNVITNPFALLSIADEVKPYVLKEENYNFYELNFCNGTLR
ncbi:MAG TPA: hypothetical protein PLO99_12780 [Chitinophagaceae bacterium]|nr:hypothetical protein [Chitinophagaceae bacterium]